MVSCHVQVSALKTSWLKPALSKRQAGTLQNNCSRDIWRAYKIWVVLRVGWQALKPAHTTQKASLQKAVCRQQHFKLHRSSKKEAATGAAPFPINTRLHYERHSTKGRQTLEKASRRGSLPFTEVADTMEDADTAELLCTTITHQHPAPSNQEATAKPASRVTMFRRDIASVAGTRAHHYDCADQLCTLQQGRNADTRAS